jgi:uncharacterized protein (DUF2132 family)
VPVFLALYSAGAVTGIMTVFTAAGLDIRMNNEINYKNHPLNGVSLKNLLIELVDHYGFEILFAYLNINCFDSNPSVDSSVKFLKKTDWAREKVEAFYIYEFKNLPRASAEQFELPPRDRIIPQGQTPGEPAKLSLEDAERLREKRAKKAAERSQGTGSRSGKRSGVQKGGQVYNRDKTNPPKRDSDELDSESAPADASTDPWAKWKSKSDR